jgi:para-nitrobenzyl esterase
MLDIVAALEWVKANISNFGGDPAKVMIFGQSGGARKTSTILGMPAARGLFRAAGMNSSDPYSQGTHEATAAIAAALVKELGLTKNTIGKIHDLPVEAIMEAGLIATPTNFWIASVDGKILPRKTFDPTAPEINADVPMMFGSVLNEMQNSVQMGDRTLEDISADELRKRLSANYKDKTDAVVAALDAAYPKATPFEKFSLAAGVAMRLNLIKAATVKTAQSKAPAYLWQFQWQSPMFDGRARAFHTSELAFVFHNTDVCQRLTGGGPVPMALADKVSDAWIAFARTGNPNHAGLPNWPAFNSKVPTMVFDNTCEVKLDHDEAIRKAMLSS